MLARLCRHQTQALGCAQQIGLRSAPSKRQVLQRPFRPSTGPTLHPESALKGGGPSSRCPCPCSSSTANRPSYLYKMAGAKDSTAPAGTATTSDEHFDDGRPSAAVLGFSIVAEEQLYRRWLALYNRTVQTPAAEGRPGGRFEFDVAGHPGAAFTAVVAFPFHPHENGTKGGEVTVLREYIQGVNEMKYVLPSGGFDAAKHPTFQAAAAAELSEEAYLTGGEWVDLLPPCHPGIPEGKWICNRIQQFLCIGPTADAASAARDAEEYIEVLRVSIPELKRILRSGEMMLPSVSTCYFALEELQERGLL